jgi:murein DD-endopeptidase MepM/ murein hydrolase activator NlpD
MKTNISCRSSSSSKGWRERESNRRAEAANTPARARIVHDRTAMQLIVRFITALAASGLALGTLGAQSARISVFPARPAPGALVRVTVATGPAGADSVVAVSGTMAGEPLHFARSASGSYRATGGMPVDAASTTAEAVITHTSGRADTVRAEIALPPLPPPKEKLDVASQFGQPLDSALEARVAREVEIAHEIGRKSHETPRLWTAPFARPRPSAITSRFGTGRTFNGQVTSRHLGVDLRGAAGAPVRAANRGVVAAVDTFYLGGRIVYIDHGEGIVTAYMHLSKFLVAVGDTVQRGQRIGLVGATGRVTGPHLHWTARYGSLTVNPLDLLTLPAPPRAKPKPTP